MKKMSTYEFMIDWRMVNTISAGRIELVVGRDPLHRFAGPLPSRRCADTWP